MKTRILILTISLIAITDIVAQVNPLGLYVDIDGKVKFWRSEANRNGNVDDTVYISFNGQTLLDDLRNLKYDYLTIVEAPRSIYTTPSNLDPSRINDTSLYSNLNETFNGNISPTLIIFDSKSSNTCVVPETLPVIQNQNFFYDDIRGDGLNDTVITKVKTILIEYVNRYSKNWVAYDERNDLYMRLSHYDTVVEKIAIYDYLVDLFITYDYDTNGHLSRVISYHWNSGVELDSLKYDEKGKLIYFLRESIGDIRNEYYFDYNEYGQVTNVSSHYSTVGPNIEAIHYANPYIEKMKFTYNNAGRMNSKSILQKEGNWLTHYFEIK